MKSDEITAQRLAGWAKKLAEDNATPLVLVGIGHEHARGKVVLCIPENGPSEKEIAQLLRNLARGLDARKPLPGGGVN
jgi:hypothetical protein